MVRPVRVGFVATELTIATVTKAAELATSAWGGLWFPVLGSDDTSLDRKMRLLGIDVCHPVDDSDFQAQRVCTAAGRTWRGRSPYGPFDAPRGEVVTRLFGGESLESIRGVARPPRVLPVWEPSDPLAALCAVHFGTFGPDDFGAMHDAAYRAGANVLSLTPDDALPFDLDVTPIASTSAGVTSHGIVSPNAAVVVIDPDSAEDLTTFWNARAVGCRVFPWPTGYESRASAALDAWLQAVVANGLTSHWKSGDGSKSGSYIGVLTRDARDVPQEIAEAAERCGINTWAFHEVHSRGWTGPHPLQTEMEHRFEVSVEDDDWVVRAPVDRLETRRTLWPGVVAVHVTLTEERDLPPGRTLVTPDYARLSKLLRSGEVNDVFQRPTGDGRVLGVQASEERVDLSLTDSLDLLVGLFDNQSMVVGRSDDGRFATQLVEVLGGTRSIAANQPAVRAVLDEVSRADRAKPLPVLLRRAADARGDWPDGFSKISDSAYAKQIVYWLLARNVVKASMPIRCPRCTTEADAPPEALSSRMICGLCGNEFPIGFALALTGRQPTWGYGLATNVPVARLRSTLPLMATLAVLHSSPRARPSIPHVL
nr:hypothetical protein [Chloroflexota bacterium]